MGDTALVVQDTQHFSFSDVVVLSLDYLIVQDAVHAQRADNVTLTGWDTILVVANAAHILVDYPPSLEVILAVANGAHAHTASVPTLVQLSTLVVANCGHALTSDEIGAMIENVTLAMNNAAHAHSVSAPTLIENVTLVIANTAHAHSVTAPTITETEAELTEFLTPKVVFTATRPKVVFSGELPEE